MALGQGINDLLKYGSIAKAGQPQSLTGDALIELGALFTQMDFDFGEEEKEEDKSDIFIEHGGTLDPNSVEYYDLNDTAEEDLASIPLYAPPKKPVGPAGRGKKVVTEQPKEVIKEEDAKDDLVINPYLGDDNTRPKTLIGAEGGGRLVQDREDLKHRLEYEKIRKEIDPNKVNKNVNSILDQINQNKQEEELFGTNRNLKNARRNVTPLNKFRLKDENNPLKRFKEEHPHVLQILKDLRYKQPSTVDSPLFRAAHIASSPFVKTDDVDYRMMKRAAIPGYAQRLGGAAAAGYNIVVDKYNYEQAVKKDYEEELDDEMGDLNIDADTINENTRKDYLELAMGKKQKLNSLFQAYSKNEISKLDFENGKAALVSELNAVATAQSNLTKIRAEYLENKGTYHIDASKPEMVDFYNTLEKNPESFSMKTIDGIDYFIGQTNSKKEVKVPTSKIANGTAGFRLVEKVSVTPVVSSAVKAVGSYSEEGMTNYGFGTKSASPEKAKEIGVANIKSQLSQDENRLRSIMATIYGVNHSTYKNFIGDDPTANKEEMLNDAAEHLYETQVKPQFFPTQKTTRIDPSKVGFGGKTQKGSVAERNRAANIARLQKIGNITPGNFNNVESEIDLTKYSLVEQEGAYYVTDKKGNVLTTLDLSNQQDTKSKLLNFMKGGGGIGQKSNQTESDPLGIN